MMLPACRKPFGAICSSLTSKHPRTSPAAACVIPKPKWTGNVTLPRMLKSSALGIDPRLLLAGTKYHVIRADGFSQRSQPGFTYAQFGRGMRRHVELGKLQRLISGMRR